MSQTYIGVTLQVLSGLSMVLGLNIAPGELDTTIKVIGLFVGALWAFWGRYRMGGITKLGFRVKTPSSAPSAFDAG